MLFIVIGAMFLPWFVIPFYSGIHNIGNIAGAALFFGFIVYGVLKVKKKLPEQNRLFRNIRAVVSALLCACFLFAGVESVFMIKAAVHTPPAGECTLIVLGCKVNGSTPSRMLRSRIQAAAEYLTEHPETKCVVSGGQGTDENLSEAECMYNELIKAGISPDRLFTETSSTSTRENLRFSNEIIQKENLSRTVVLVTNEFHQYRATLTAKEQGLSPYAVSAVTEAFLLPTYWFREFFGILAEWIM